MPKLEIIGIVFINEEGKLDYLEVKEHLTGLSLKDDRAKTLIGKKPGRIVNHPSPREEKISRERKTDYSLSGRLKKAKGK